MWYGWQPCLGHRFCDSTRPKEGFHISFPKSLFQHCEASLQLFLMTFSYIELPLSKNYIETMPTGIRNRFAISAFLLHADYQKKTSNRGKIYLLPLEEVVQCPQRVFRECRPQDGSHPTTQLRTKIMAEFRTPKVHTQCCQPLRWPLLRSPAEGHNHRHSNQHQTRC